MTPVLWSKHDPSPLPAALPTQRRSRVEHWVLLLVQVVLTSGLCCLLKYAGRMSAGREKASGLWRGESSLPAICWTLHFPEMSCSGVQLQLCVSLRVGLGTDLTTEMCCPVTLR